jgi:hypothetical protein
MNFLHPRFWFRVLVAGTVLAALVVAIVITGHGGWGPCGPSDAWGMLVGLAALLSAATAAVAVPGLALSALLRVLVRPRPR